MQKCLSLNSLRRFLLCLVITIPYKFYVLEKLTAISVWSALTKFRVTDSLFAWSKFTSIIFHNCHINKIFCWGIFRSLCIEKKQTTMKWSQLPPLRFERLELRSFRRITEKTTSITGMCITAVFLCPWRWRGCLLEAQLRLSPAPH